MKTVPEYLFCAFLCVIFGYLAEGGCSKMSNLPTSLAKPENDGRTEWTKEGKAKLRAEREALQKLHDQWAIHIKDSLSIVTNKENKWLVVITTCGVGVNNMVHGGWWPYSSARPFNTEPEARKFMDRWCDPHGCVLVYGVEK